LAIYKYQIYCYSIAIAIYALLNVFNLLKTPELVQYTSSQTSGGLHLCMSS
jgi:hypothetical protein